MFQEQREYRSIAFVMPGLESASDVLSLISKESSRECQALPISTADFEIAHSHYYSETRFTPSEELEELKVTKRGAEVFRYNVYVFRLEWRRARVFFVAVPFFRMAWEVFPKLREAARGKGLQYQRASVDKLFKVLLSEEAVDNRPSIGLTSFNVLGDPLLQTLAFNGDDILHSQTYSRLRSSLGGVELSPKKCQIVYDDHKGKRFRLNTDYLGNYQFRIGKGAMNLPCATPADVPVSV